MLLTFSEIAPLVAIIYGPFLLIALVLGTSWLREKAGNVLTARRAATVRQPAVVAAPVAAARAGHVTAHLFDHLALPGAEAA